MDIEVRHLNLVLTVAEEKSLTKAGTRLHLTQSALSHQLRDIEDKLGVPLFHRLNKKMVLTQAGERLLSSAHVVHDELKRAAEDIRRMAKGHTGKIRISTECYTCYYWLPPVLTEFNRAFPEVEVQIMVDATRHPIKSLVAGKLDVALITERPDDSRLRYEPLFRDELVAITAPDHRLAGRRYVRAEDFADEHLIIYSVSEEESTLFQKVLNPAGVRPKQTSQMQLTEAIVEMVKAGLGISVMGRWAVKPQLDSGELVAIPLTSGRGFHRQWNAAMLKENAPPIYLHEFVKLLAARTGALLEAHPAFKEVRKGSNADRHPSRKRIGA